MRFLNKTVELRYSTLIILLSFFVILMASGLIVANGTLLKLSQETKNVAGDELPTFHQYAVNLGDSYDGKIAEVDLNSHPKAQMFRTALREGVKNGPNFAFYYTVVMWGCGSECQSFAIVDVRDGKVYFPDVGSRRGMDFEENSNLLIIDPVKNIYEVGGQDLDTSSEYYVWENNQLTLIKTAKVRYTIVQ